MAYQHILYEYEEDQGIGALTLNRPGTRNALSLHMLEELSSCLEGVADKGEARVIILRGAGAAFCSGHDLKEILGNELKHIRHLFHTCGNLMMLIHSIPQAVIAQVHGIATAAGCQLVAACDLAVAEETAQFATPGVKIGLFCATPMVALTRTMGRKAALEMLLTGRSISAKEAMAYGLISRVAAEGHVEEETRRLAREIAQYSLVTLGLGKQAFYQQVEMAEAQAYHYAKEVISSNAVMTDAVEGMRAFFEKRAPVWRGR